ncbi:MAG: hypothetical protein IKN94_06730 [Salinivirgaceae bacterium]|nr:hypothetical protein [Salinivirgaceae bacterium]
MIFEIVFGIICFVWGVVILTGKVDKWLIYGGKKQMNEKQFRLITGIGNLLGGSLFFLGGCFGCDSIILVLLAILSIVIITLQNTWCRKMPENQTA